MAVNFFENKQIKTKFGLRGYRGLLYQIWCIKFGANPLIFLPPYFIGRSEFPKIWLRIHQHEILQAKIGANLLIFKNLATLCDFGPPYRTHHVEFFI